MSKAEEIAAQPRKRRGRPRAVVNIKEQWEIREGSTKISVLPREAEAFYLTDGLGHSQTEAAKLMGISQSTVGRLVAIVRRKMAEAMHKSTTVDVVVQDDEQ